MLGVGRGVATRRRRRAAESSRLRGHAHGSVGFPSGTGETFARAANSPGARVSPFLLLAVHVPPRLRCVTVRASTRGTGAGSTWIRLWLWVGFNGFVLAMLAVDLFVFHKEAHEVPSAEAATWSVVWVALARAVRRRRVCLHGARCRPGVFRRLPHREGTLSRQYLRLCPDFRLLSRPAALSASRVVLGHPRRPGHARCHDRRGRLPDRTVPLGHLRVRRLSGLHRHPDGDAEGARPRSRIEPRHSHWCAASCRSQPPTTVRSSSCENTSRASCGS